MGWLVRSLGIDGLYLDDVSYDRHTLKRMRGVLDLAKKGCLLDLHSNTAFSIGPANQYMEFMPNLDRLWFGEFFDYNEMTPDEWLVRVSGIPFGLMGDMLHKGGNQWRGTLFGMTARMGWATEHILCDPRNVWKLLDEFGIAESEMIGFWEKDCPIRTDNPNVKATVYRKKSSVLIALANWARSPLDVSFEIDWKALGLDSAKAKWSAPACEGFQPHREFFANRPIPIEPFKGWMLVGATN